MNYINNKKIIKHILAKLIPRIFINLYLMIKYGCLIDIGAKIMFSKNLKIGKGTIIGKCDITAQGPINIGKKCLINDYVILNSKSGSIEIGDNTTINNFSIVYGNGGVKIGHDSAIAHSVKIIKKHKIPALNHNYGGATSEPTKIGDYVWLCANAVLIDGVTLGDNVIVGANSFVNKNIPDNSIYAGNPVRLIKMRQ